MFGMDLNVIYLSILFSIIGIGYFSYGRKQNFYYSVSGIALILFSFFVTNVLLMITLGIIFIVLPFILNWFNPL